MTQTPFQATYIAGKIIQVTVPSNISIAGEEYIFVKWEDNSTNVTRNITMSSDITLTAVFALSTPMQAGFPLWSLPIMAGIALVVYVMGKDKKKKPS